MSRLTRITLVIGHDPKRHVVVSLCVALGGVEGPPVVYRLDPDSRTLDGVIEDLRAALELRLSGVLDAYLGYDRELPLGQ